MPILSADSYLKQVEPSFPRVDMGLSDIRASSGSLRHSIVSHAWQVADGVEMVLRVLYRLCIFLCLGEHLAAAADQFRGPLFAHLEILAGRV